MMQHNIRLMEYWLGLLDPSERDAVETELSVSEALRVESQQVQATLEKLGSLPPALRPSSGLGERLMASLDDGSRFDGFLERLTHFLDLSVDRVRELLGVAAVAAADAPGWRKGGLLGLITYPFRGGPNIEAAECQMLYLEPDCVFPDHRHNGSEWGFVLQGALVEPVGNRYDAGDIVYQAAGSHHTFRVDGDRPAILFVILDGTIDWLGEQ